MSLLRRSVSLRLALSLCALIVITMSSLGLYLLSSLQELAIHQLQSSLVTQGRLLAPQLADEIRSGDGTALGNYLERVDRETATRVLVVDADGRLVASSEAETRSEIGQRLEMASLSDALAGRDATGSTTDLSHAREIAYAAIPIESDGKVLGALRLSYELSDIRKVIRGLTLLVGKAVAGAGLLALAIGLGIGTSLTRPIRSLVRGTEALRHGDLSARVALTSTDEIGEFAQAFNSLAEQLQNLEGARRDLLSDVSHEIHTLAGAMSMAADALERGALRDPVAGERLVHGMSGHTRLLGRLADDLLETVRVESGRFSVQLAQFSVGELLEQIRADFGPEADRRGVEIVVRSEDTEFILVADPERLAQAIGNLIDNALRVTPAGGRIALSAYREGSDFVLAVADTGPGITASDRARVFDRFYHSEDRNARAGRLGLGLAIVKAIAEAHGGSALVESEPGFGAVFSLRFPVDVVPDPSGSSEVAAM